MWRKEPVLIALSGLDGVVVALLTAAMTLGLLDIDGTQLAAISAAVVAVTGFVAAILRGHVVSPDTYENDVLEAMWTPVGVDDLDHPDTFSGDTGDLDDDPAAIVAWGGDV
jgi:hypothetical protein